MLRQVVAKEQQELERREHLYRDGRPGPELCNHVVILIDDGLATGATMRAAITALQQQQPAKIIIAVPVSSSEACCELRAEVDDIICVMTPQPFHSVSLWYDNFPQTTDEEFRNLLKRAETTVSSQ